MSAPAGAQREPRPSAVSMRALLAAGAAATAVSTPPVPARGPAGDGGAPGDGKTAREGAAPESEAA
ncbi:hypothetical protein [Streptomyces sp. CB00455]|uniref:hypothetical protein n=1 Tax=Streptomyces sp. CB00455 TaxID=1703927 RepID=UPI00093987DE|nr:hypothetical protein [Streptomyces sp. CB00455]